MIKLINNANKHKHMNTLDQMFRLRKATFHDRLGWDVRLEGDWEIDQFDELNPTYVLSVNEETGQVVGSLRLLPTTGPNMLMDVFPQLLEEKSSIRSGSIWESSRFCVDRSKHSQRSGNSVAVATAELMAAVGELALSAGVTQIVTVTDLTLERIFSKMGCLADRLGDPCQVGKTKAVAVFWPVTASLLSDIKTTSGIKHNLTDAQRGHLAA